METNKTMFYETLWTKRLIFVNYLLSMELSLSHKLKHYVMLLKTYIRTAFAQPLIKLDCSRFRVDALLDAFLGSKQHAFH